MQNLLCTGFEICPFCGGQEQEVYTQGKDYWVWCKCGVQGSHAVDPQKAKSLWNTRINNQALGKH